MIIISGAQPVLYVETAQMCNNMLIKWKTKKTAVQNFLQMKANIPGGLLMIKDPV